MMNIIRTLAFLATLSPVAALAVNCPNDDNWEPKNTGITAKLDPTTVWAPRGGKVRVTVDGASSSLDGMIATACFRWTGTTKYLSPAFVQLVESNGPTVPGKVVYQVTVPPSGLDPVSESWPARWFSTSTMRFDNMGIVPFAEMRLMLGANKDAPLVDVVLDVGVTSVIASSAAALSMTVLTVIVLLVWAKSRQVPGEWAPMRLISSRFGYASLSQLQIMIWSFLFGAGAIYVMVLSGSLIDIPDSALVLLGIAGVSTVGAKIQGSNAAAQSSAQPEATVAAATQPPNPVTNLIASGVFDESVALSWTAPAPAAGDPPATYRVEYSRATKAGAPPAFTTMGDWRVARSAVTGTAFLVNRLRHSQDHMFQVFAMNAAGISAPVECGATTLAPQQVKRMPQWADLIMTPQHPGEVDVTRVQMLFFTLISAAFVAIKLFTSYTIPVIPEGFMLLMGISNGVYLTAKFVPD